MRLADRFPSRQFLDTTALVAAPDGSNRVFVAQRRGRVFLVRLPDLGGPAKVSPVEQVLDLGPTLSLAGRQDGLLGIAPHPRFTETKRLFATYVVGPPSRFVLARFDLGAGPPDLVRRDGVPLLDSRLPHTSHRGGGLAFGPDGYLYVGIGDGGGRLDPFGRTADMESLLGKVLRLDVDAIAGSGEYAVPPANPLVGNRDEQREEIFAVGFCDPRQIAGGRPMWVADSTSGYGEEVHALSPGRHHGWPYDVAGRPTHRRLDAGYEGPSTRSAPAIAYVDVAARRIAGVIPYLGRRWPSLAGTLIVADGPTGQVWAVRPGRAVPAALPREPLLRVRGGIATVGQDPDREPLIVGTDGHLYGLD